MADKSTLSPVKLALAEIRELRARLDDVARERSEPIAIVGLAGRFPGAPDTDRLWELLREGRVGIVDIPADRWDVAAYFDPDPEAPGKMYTYRGGFLSEVDRFDPHFFGISPREAVSMDPQQRLLLETTWRALEDAAISPASLSGTQAGVFVGLSNIDYYRMAFTDPQAVDAYFGSGTSGSVAAGRISYVLGLRGPSLAVDTACSSSLVAVHLACQSLRNKECGVALAGGVNLILSPDINIACSKAKMMSPDGLCKTFDARADGYVRSEGCAVVVLKRLSDAERDGDRVLAVIRGSAVNQDGRSSGLTVPNGPAQEAVIRRALDLAGVEPRDIAYVEAHGTGTSLGDPIEVRALGRVMGDRGPGGAPLAVGSIKANIGHLEAAAGIAGLAKVVLALQHETIPGHPNLGERNPHIEWPSLPVDVVTAPRPWPAGSGRRIAGVSSFGFSGTNAHVIVEAASASSPSVEPQAERPRQILTLSARSAEALDDLTASFADFLGQTSEPFAEICATANAGRLHAAHRMALVAGSTTEAAEALGDVLRGDTPRVIRRNVEGAAPDVAFLFTGQGAQYAGMARVLYETVPAFRRIIDDCDRLLATELDRPLLSVLFGSDDDTRLLSQTAYAQPALFAIEYALAQLWQSWGIVPAAVLGHSVGELVAACVAGVFTLEDGLRLIAARGRLMQALPDDGAMVSVFAGESIVQPAIAGWTAAVSIAAFNGPEQVVISGERPAVKAIVDGLAAQGVSSRDLEASRAFHSPLLEPMLQAFADAASRISFSAPRIPIISNLTGERAGSEIATADYWVRHARQPVRFQQGIDALRAAGTTAFLEVGPQPTLLGMARRFADAPGVEWLPSLRKGRDDWDDMLSALATLYAAGWDVDWTAFDGRRPRRRVAVPGHPFRRQRYWLANDGSTAARVPQRSGDVVHPLLGVRNDSPLRDVVFEQYLSASAPGYLAEHRVFESVVFPATGYVEMALAAGQAIGGRVPAVDELVIAEPLVLPETGERRVQAVFTPRGDRDGALQVFSRSMAGETSEWHLHASAVVRLDGAPVSGDTLESVRSRCGESVSSAAHYDLFSRSGLDYGPSFRGITQLWPGNSEAVASIELPADEAAGGYTLHPGLLDSCFHTLLAALPGGAAAFTGRHFYLPVSIDRVAAARAAGSAVWAHARLRPLDGEQPEAFTGDVTVFDADGGVLASISGLTAKRATADAVKASAQRSTHAWFHTLQWQPREIATTTPAAADWLVVDDGTAAAEAMASRLAAEGAGVERVPQADAIAALDRWAAREAAARPSRILIFASEEDRAGVDAGGTRLQHAAAILGRIAALMPRFSQLAGVTVVTRGATGATERGLAGQPLLSLVSALGAEHTETRCVAIDLDAADSAELDLLGKDLTRPDAEDQIAYRGGRRFVARLERAAAPALGGGPAAGPVALTISERGILDNLRLTPMTRRVPGPGEVEIEIRASGLNFRDVLNALGMYPGDPGALGNECVGVVAAVGAGVTHVAAGDRVMALVHGGFQSFVVTPGQWVVRIPEGMDFRAAATIPMAFTTAEYSLNRLAGLQRGERVLIHAATGGVGLAAVQIAIEAGAEIFATAGSDEKRALLRSMGVTHVMNSRTVEFAEEILAATGGEGVDVVLNSLTGEAIPKSLSVLRQGGRFCEIGKRGIWSDAQVAAIRPDIRYFTIFLADVDDALIYEMLQDLASRFTSSALQPLPMRVFMLSDAASAFRHMAQARHIGKVVIARDADAAPVTVRPEATYLITGGFGGLGLRIASELAAAGARHLVLVGRSGLTSSASPAVAALESRGVRVLSAAADVSRDDDVARLFEHIAATMPPLAGIVHAAGLRDDGLLSALEADRFAGVLAPKVAGGWNLHRHSERLALDFFVLFSSAASVLPSPAQGSYAAANGFLDALARYRRGLGLPALAINWGPWDEVGMAAGLSQREQQRWARHGVQFIAPDAGARAFVRALSARVPQLAIVAADWRKFADERPGGIPLLADLVASSPALAAPRQTQAAAGARAALIEELERAPRSRRRDTVLTHVREQVRQVLALEAGFNLEPHQGLRDVGMDSLMALELRNRLQRTTGKPLPATLTFDRPTVAALSAYIADEVLAVSDESTERAPAAPVAAASAATDADDIAIVGIGCRFPGDADSSDAFWRLLHDGVDAISEIPADRWDVDEYFDPTPDTPGKMYTRYGGFVRRVDEFDPHFFGISPRESTSLDPQQRLLLEVTWEALEHAGVPPHRLLGERGGVFVGIGTYDYALLHMKQPNPAELDAYFGTGTSLSVAAGRLAYSLGLQGPAMSIDTACSSSLVAVHLASKSLRERECNIALAGGVNLMLTPEPWVNGCRARMLAPDGRCKTFDASADGYARAEGAGVVVLKRLGDAIAAGDRVLAVIRGTAVNQDGRSSGLTVPNGPSQQAVIRDALASARVQPSDVQYVEAHGTGTALGDPIEIEALRSALMAGRSADRPLVVGSVKTNIGHLEAAAGVAGLIKVVMALRQQEIPKHLHFTALNPHIELDGAPLEIAAENRPWPRAEARRIAGISSFGFSGTNAHVIVEEAPVASERPAADVERPVHIVALGAKSERATRELAGRYADSLSGSPDGLADIAFTANTGRTHFGHRAAVVAATATEAREALAAYAAGAAQTAVRAGEAAGTEPNVAFLFTGQGAQYAGMGRQLYDTHREFRRTLDTCDEILRGVLDVPLLSVLYPESPDGATLINETAYTQPALFAVEYALAQLWQSWGVRPAAVLGHSVGEYVAACVAGVFSMEDGLRLIAARARLMQAQPPGAMAAVFTGEAAVREAIDWFADAISIAAINGPEHTVISGQPEALESALASLQKRGISGQRLTVSHAFHSAAMDPMLDEFERIAAGVTLRAPQIPLASNLTGVAAGSEIATAKYWRDHIRQPVRFSDGVNVLREHGSAIYLEAGPRPTLLGMARRAAAIDASACLPSLRPPKDDWPQMLDTLAALHVAGAAIDWCAFDAPYSRARVTVPSYPFQRERYWIPQADPADAARPRTKASDRPGIAEIVWRDRQGVPSAVPAGRWILFADTDGVAAKLAATIAAAGGRAILVGRGAPYAAAFESASPHAVLDPADPGQFRQLFGAAAATLGPIDGVMHLWALDAHTGDASALQSALHTVQALASGGFEKMPRYVVVTRGAAAVDDFEPVNPAQAPVAGFVRSVALEHPELRSLSVDLEASTADAADVLWREVVTSAASATERSLAVRGARVLVPRLVHTTPAATSHFEFHADASYLITGGTGGVGLRVARWASDRGARTLVVTSRRAPGDDAARVFADIEASGTRVVLMHGDVADQRFVDTLIAAIRQSHPPLRGVFHAAGVLDDGVVLQQTWERVARVTAAKVDGAWHLHQATRDLALDAFVLFSSTASIIGVAGQSSYSAANAFLDALAHHRRALLLPALTINWGPWADAGMAAAGTARLAARGIAAMPADAALSALDTLLASGATQRSVIAIDWPAYVKSLGPSAPALLEELGKTKTAERAATSLPAAAGPGFRDQVGSAPAFRRRDLVLARVRQEVAGVLALGAGFTLDDRKGLRDLGLDSLMAVDLRNRLQTAVEAPLPATLAFDQPTVEALCDYLMAEVFGAQSARGREARARADAAEPIAIVGVGCRMPGGANDPDAFWQLLRDGVDGISEVPADRWNAHALYDADPSAPGKMNTRWGGFLRDVDLFEPQFFGISPREAVFMDPQQRIVLEVSWEALEHAGIRPDRLAGSRSGVFVGVSTYDYGQMLMRAGDRTRLDAHIGTGISPSVTAGRLSYVLGLQGPAMSVDTACSSSLVSVHLACQSLRSGECRMALAGGVNLVLLPESNIVLSKARMLSPDGRCKTFDARADGYVRSDGCGMVVLKRLSDAIADGDRVLAVIRGSAVNQDGRSSGLTVPNGPAQEALIREALSVSDLEPGDVSYVEAHGTGTPLGDPIEVRAIAAALGDGRSADHRLLVGSVKTNLGHLEAAAGVAALIKVVLALQHEQVPPHLHFVTPNPHLPWAELPVQIPTSLTPWMPVNGRRIAGISSFGFSGTNAHVILEQAQASPARAVAAERSRHVLVLSARSETALTALAARYEQRLASMAPADAAAFADLCFTASAGRAHFPHRTAIVAADAAEARQKLRQLREGDGAVHRGIADGSTAAARVGFAFPSQVNADDALIRTLPASQPAFAAALETCAGAPASFAVQYALAAMWRAWGVQPAAVAGDGPGAVAALAVAGALPLKQAVALAKASGVAPDIEVEGPIATVVSNGHPVEALQRAGAGAVIDMTLPSGQDVWTTLLDRLASLYVAGVEIDWIAFDAGYERRKVGLPTYPFERERYWVDLPERAAEADGRNLLYTTEWRQQPRAAAIAPPDEKRGTWIIFAGAQDRGPALARALEVRGHRTMLADDVSALQNGGAILGVVDLRNLDVNGATGDVPERALQETTATLELMQALLRLPSPPPLWIATRDAHAVAGSAASGIAHAPVWGLAATAALEHPELRTVRIDLPVDGDVASDVAALDAELRAPDGETQIAIRDARYVARFAAAPPLGKPPATLSTDGTYLVTGGLGALGLQIARTLADAGARHVLLTSRRAPGAEAEKAIDALRHRGIRVSVERADVSRVEDVRRLMTTIAADRLALRGVVHAAGVIEDAALMQADTARLGRVMAPKVAGAWNLHVETRQLPLDFFVLFSSIAGVLGSPGQSGYGAANAFLDALAHQRRAAGLPASSIAWGPWEQAGLAAGLTSQRRWSESGIAPLAPANALQIFGAVIGDGRANLAVLDVAWDRLAGATASRLDPRFIGDFTTAAASATEPAVPALRQQIERAPAASRLDIGRRFVIGEVAAVLGLSPAAAGDPNKGLQDLGLDSLLALELRERLQRAIGAALPSTLVFDYPTVEALAVHLVEDVIEGTDRPEPAAVASTETADLLLRIEDLSDEQVEAMLSGKLPAEGI